MNNPALDRLIRLIAARLDQGLLQDAATAHCLASTLGPLSPDVLAARLDDPDDDEAGPLRELLLFPGPDTALALEAALADAACSPADEVLLIQTLAAHVRQVRVCLPGLPDLRLTVSAGDLTGLVHRLHPTHSLPAGLRQILKARFPPAAARTIAVAGRQAGLAWNRPRESFLATLLSRLDPATPQCPDAVRFALGFLADLAPETPPLAALPKVRERLERQLDRARAQETALAGSNFETLAMTGVRLPYLHTPDIARELALLDTVLEAVTGRAGASRSAVRRDMGTVTDFTGLLGALAGLGD